MKILQSAFAKSGNLWLFRVLQEILKAEGVNLLSFIQDHPIHPLAKTWPLSNPSQADLDFIDITPQGCFYRISSIFRMPIEDLEAYLSRCTIVRTHSAYCWLSGQVFDHFDRVIYLIRDPRDVLLSFSKYVFTPYFQKFYPHPFTDGNEYIEMNLEARMFMWVRHVSGHLAHINSNGLYTIFYERLKNDFRDEVGKIVDALDMQLSAIQLDHIQEVTSIQTMRAANPGHVRTGKAGGWMLGLTQQQQHRATFCTAPLLRLMGYPTRTNSVSGGELPGLPENPEASQFINAAKRCYLRIGLAALRNGQFSAARIRRVLNNSA